MFVLGTALLDALRTEVVYGECLDLLATGNLTENIEIPLTVIRYKIATTHAPAFTSLTSSSPMSTIASRTCAYSSLVSKPGRTESGDTAPLRRESTKLGRASVTVILNSVVTVWVGGSR